MRPMSAGKQRPFMMKEVRMKKANNWGVWNVRRITKANHEK